MAAGNLGRARELLEGLVSSIPPGTARADALRRLATVRYRQDSPAVAAEVLTRALAEAGRTVPGGVHQRDLLGGDRVWRRPGRPQ